MWTICPNRRGCPGQTFQHVKHFRGAMDIEGLGEKNADALPRRGPDQRPGRHLRPHRRAHPGARRVRRGLGAQPDRGDRGLQGAARSASSCTPSGCPGVGYVNAQALAEHFGTIDALIEADAEEIEEVEGIGPILAEQLQEELSDEPTLELIQRLRERGLRFELSAGRAPRRRAARWRARRSCSPAPCADLTREEATEMIRRAGGKVTGSVSKKHRLRGRRRQPRLEARQGRGAGGTTCSTKRACASCCPGLRRRAAHISAGSGRSAPPSCPGRSVRGVDVRPSSSGSRRPPVPWPALAVARQGADAVQGPGLGAAAALGRPSRPCGPASVPSRRRAAASCGRRRWPARVSIARSRWPDRRGEALVLSAIGPSRSPC